MQRSISCRSRSRSHDKTALKGKPTYAITGAGKGIGLELTRQLAGEGATVYALVQSTAPPEIREIQGDVIILENIDVSHDDVGSKLAAALSGAGIDCLVNNAGIFGGPRVWNVPTEMFATQSIQNCDVAKMRDAFETNVLGPFKVTKALLPQMRAPGGKVVFISSLMGSIEDNTSGGQYGYRTSKAALNMVGRTFAADLREKGIAVGLIHPGMVATSFAGDISKLPQVEQHVWRDVESVARGVIMAIKSLTLESTGSFVHGNYGQGLKSCPW